MNLREYAQFAIDNKDDKVFLYLLREMKRMEEEQKLKEKIENLL